MFCKVIALLVFLSALSCSRHTETAVRRIAILRFENLSGDASLGWMGRGIAELLASQLEGKPGIVVLHAQTLHALDGALGFRPLTAPGVSSERTQATLAGAGAIVYGYYSVVNSRLHVDAVLEETATQKVSQTVSAGGPASNGIVSVVDSVAHQLGAVRPPPTKNALALQEYSAALDTRDTRTAAQALSRAIAADPDFGPAYLLSAQILMAQGDRAALEQILKAARNRGNTIPDLDRARLETEIAMKQGDLASRETALQTLARLDAYNPGLFRSLGELELNTRHYSQAIQNLRKAAALQPEDPLPWNLLGYAQMYGGDLDGAIRSFREYERLRPQEANPQDSIGDAYFYFGRFADAEKSYLQAFGKDPRFLEGGPLLKAALAKLMSGDQKTAETDFARFVDIKRAAKDPVLEYRAAEWEFLTGRRRAAIDRLDRFARTLQAGDVSCRAWAQLTIWELQLGEAARAREHALKASAPAGASCAGVAAVSRFLTEPPASASEWAVRAERMFPDAAQSGVKNLALGYALLLSREFGAAAPLWKQIYDELPSTTQEGVPVMLAWALLESGHAEEAKPRLQNNPLPPATGLGPFTSLHFPRLFFLRAVTLEKEGRREEAGQNYRLFLNLSGADPEIFGEEQRARAALGR